MLYSMQVPGLEAYRGPLKRADPTATANATHWPPPPGSECAALPPAGAPAAEAAAWRADVGAALAAKGLRAECVVTTYLSWFAFIDFECARVGRARVCFAPLRTRRFPKWSRKAVAVEATLEAGDLLYLPRGW